MIRKKDSYIGDKKEHIRLYKKGKLWLASAISMLSVGLGLSSNVDQAKADTANENAVSEETNDNNSAASTTTTQQSAVSNNATVAKNVVNNARTTAANLGSTSASQQASSSSKASSQSQQKQASQNTQQAKSSSSNEKTAVNSSNQSSVTSSSTQTVNTNPTSSTQDSNVNGKAAIAANTVKQFNDVTETIYDERIGSDNEKHINSNNASTIANSNLTQFNSISKSPTSGDAVTVNIYIMGPNTSDNSNNILNGQTGDGHLSGGAFSYGGYMYENDEGLSVAGSWWNANAVQATIANYLNSRHLMIDTTKGDIYQGQHQGYNMSKEEIYNPYYDYYPATWTYQIYIYTLPAKYTVKVNYVDDDDGDKVVKTVTLPASAGTVKIGSGIVDVPDSSRGGYRRGTVIHYDPTSDIASLTGYAPATTADGQTHNIRVQGLPLYGNKAQVQTITIHLKHATKQQVETKTSTRTIHYEYNNGQPIDGGKYDTTDTVTYTRTDTVDEVTGNIISSTPWVATNNVTSYPEHTSPTVAGYIPDQQTVPAVSNVPEGTANSTVNVVYSPRVETVTIQYVDDDNDGSVINSVQLTGTYGSTTTYDPTSEENALKKNGYIIGSSNLPADGVIPFNSDNITTYTIHVTHSKTTYTAQDNPNNQYDLTKTIKRVINYVDANGNPMPGITDTITDSATFNRTVTVDNVTHQVISYSDWEPASGSSTSFPDHKSPEITGYTPSVQDVPAETVTINSDNQTVTVRYTPNATTVHINYVDDDEGGKVVYTDSVSGPYGSTIIYDPSVTEKNMQTLGYIIGNSNLPTGDKITIQDVNGSLPTYTVHMTHSKKNISGDSGVPNAAVNKDVKRTIHYQYSDGSAVPGLTDVVQNIHFHRTATVDGVTHQVISYTPWVADNNDEFPSVQSPVVTGYTPTIQEVPAIPNVSESDDDSSVTVTYTPNKEHAVINYVDSTNGNIVHSDTVNGTYGQTVTYDPSAEEATLQNQGYTISSTDFPSNGMITFNVDGYVPTYTVYLNHSKTTYTPQNNPNNQYNLTDTIKRTIHYQYNNGNSIPTIPDVVDTITYHRNAIVDNITHTVTYTPWVADDNVTSFPEHTSPSLTGYTPDQPTVPEVDNVQAGSTDQSITVTYTPIQSQINIQYVDDDNQGQVVYTDRLTGSYDSTTTYDPSNEEKILEGKGYVIGSSDLPANGQVTFGANKITYTIHLTHATKTVNTDNNNNPNITLTHDVTRTIHFQDSNGNAIPGLTDVTQTVHFTRTAKVDAVTGQAISYSDWEPTPSTNDTLSAYQAPTVTGYTPNTQTVPEVDNVTESTQNSTVTITYTANKEHAIVNYVDDSDGGKIIHTDTVNGTYGQTVTYDPTATDNTLTGQGYVIGSSNLPSNDQITFSNDGYVPTYTVHVTHKTTTYTPSTNPDGKYDLTHTVKRTIHYQYSNGQPIPNVSDVTDSVTFNRTVTVDDVTGQVVSYSNWTPAGSTTYPSHVSPTVTGYTPDQPTVPEITGVSEDNTDTTVTVNYSPNKEHAVVNYVDDSDGGKVIHTDTVNGTYGSTATYDPSSEESTLTKQGYVIGNSDLPTNGQITFSQDGQVPTYTVHVTHGTTTYTSQNNPNGKYQLTDTTTRTIHYQYSNGNNIPGLSDVKDNVTYTRTVTVDNVTGQVVSYSDWTPTNNVTSFPAHQSPAVTGYTPNTQTVPEVDNIKPGTADSTTTVTYSPNKEQVTINYVDDDDNGNIVHTDTINGLFGSTTTYDPSNEEKVLEGQGYIIGSSNLPSNDTITFNATNQTYTIHLTHATKTVNPSNNTNPNIILTHDVTRTIHYQYSNGQAIPGLTDVTQTVHFTRTAKIDSVTGQAVSYSDWTPSSTTDDFPSYQSPTVTGYTPDKQTVPEVDNVTEDTPDSTVNVTYSANPEHAIVNYVDDSDGGKIIHTDTVNGTYGSTVTYDPTNTDNTLTKQGYVIGNSNLPTGDKIPFSVDGYVPTYTVHLTHGTTTYTPSTNPDGKYQLTHNVTRTIHYQYNNGQPIPGVKDVTDTVTYNRNVTVDNVTGQVVSYSNWTPAGSTTYPSHVSPTVTGYTPDQPTVPSVSGVAENDSDTTVTVTYNPNKEHAVINYVDDDENGKVVHSDTVDGVYGGTSTYDPTSEENTLKNDGYTIGSSDLPANGQITFSQDGQVPTYTIHLTHSTTTYTPQTNPDGKYQLTDTINRTIHYQYSNGDAIPNVNDVTDSVTYNRTVTVDNVTGQVVSYSNWTPVNNVTSFPDRKSPEVTGYTPDKPDVPAVSDVQPGTKDTTVTVNYSANKEQVTINYVDDDNDGSIVHTDTINGLYGSTTTYDPSNEEKVLEGQGYIIGSSDLPAGDTITFNATNQTYTIHLTHATKTVNPDNNTNPNIILSHNVTRTIHFQYSNGQDIPGLTDVTQTVTFTRTAKIDAVTGQAISYSDWTPSGTDDFPSYKSPSLTGYTPDKQSVPEVDNVSESAQDSTINVTYSANPEHAIVNYVDDDDGEKIVHTDTVNGTFDSTVTYDPTDTDKTLTGQGYIIGSSNLPTGDKITFSNDGYVPTYTVHVSHATHTVNPSNNPDPSKITLTHDVTRTVHYQYSNGQSIPGLSDVTQTIHFTRTANIDSVTGQVVSYGNWTPSGSDDFPLVPSPQVNGYTPDQTSVPSVTDVPEDTQNSTVNITYNANKEHAVVNYVDDTDGGKVIHSDTVNGTFGSTVTYDPTSEEDTLKNSGYVIGNSDLPANGQITFSTDGQVPTYTIHVTHGTTTYTPQTNPDGKYQLTDTTTRTIHYQYSDGQPTSIKDVTDTVTYNRNVTVDNVTGQVVSYSDWTPVNNVTGFPDHQSPSLTGYTPDKPDVPAVSDVQPGTANSTVTVTYSANKEQVTINYVDDDEDGKIVHTDVINGLYNTTTTYDPSNEEKVLEGQGYVIGSSNLPAGGNITFNATDQTYTIHLTHGTSTVNPSNNTNPNIDLTKDVTRTIYYQYSNGQPVPGLTNVTQTVHFTRTAKIDSVTGQAISYSDWTPSGSDTFSEVKSPQVTGYTPNIASVPAVQTVTSDTKSSAITVIYNVNSEHAIVNYVDDDDGEKIIHTDTVNGTFGSTVTYDPTNTDTTLTNQGYIIGSSNLPTGDKITFTHDGYVPTYTVHVTHGTHTVTPADNPDPSKITLTHDVTRTIHYQYSNGQPIPGLGDVTQTIHYTRTANIDSVTGQVVSYGDWTPSGTDDFPSVSSPQVNGYTPDQPSVPAQTDVPEDTQNSTVTVNYNANKEHAVINYVDDSDNGKIIHTDTVNGTFGSTETYDPSSEEGTLTKQGYVIGNSNLPTGGKITFSTDGYVPTYTIHVTHGTTTYTPQNNPNGKYNLTDTTTRTIKYQYSNGQPIASIPNVTDTVTYNRTVTVDNVTGNVISYSDWTPVDNVTGFPDHKSPALTGYTPDKTDVPAVSNVQPGAADSSVTVTYSADKEQVTINYVDDDEDGKIVHTDSISGLYGSTTTYDPTNEEKVLEGQGYIIGNSNLPAGGNITFNATDQTYTIHLTHATNTVNPSNNTNPNIVLTHDVTRTVHYQYSNGQAIPGLNDVTQTVHFTRTAKVDAVTGQAISYSDWTPSGTDTFPEVKSLQVTGYTPDKQSVPASATVNETDQNSTVNVTYSANPEHAVINYVDDDDGGKVIHSDTVNGTFGSTVTYDPSATDSALTKQGYVIGNSDLPAGDQIPFSVDGYVPTYTVHVTHGSHTVTPADNPDPTQIILTHDVTRKIHYQYSNGQPIPNVSDVTQTIHFTRTANVDSVTGKVISYGDWTPSGTDDFPLVQSPQVTGYTPDQTNVPSETNVPESTADNTVTVTYSANKEHAVVNYVDDTDGGKIIHTDTVNGTFGSTVTYDPSTEEGSLTKQGYIIGSNDLPTGGKITFSQDGQVPTYTIHVTHGTHTVTPDQDPTDKYQTSHTITRKIHYQYSNGQPIPNVSDVTDSVTYHRTATVDNVTGNVVSYTDWTPVNNVTGYPDRKSPAVTGYTPDKPDVPAQTDVPETAQDSNITVTYSANPEHAVVNYVDDDENGKVVYSDTVNGVYGGTSTYNPSSEETKLKNAGYIIGNSDLPANGQITFTKDGDVPTYTIHLTHSTQTVDPSTNPDPSKIILTHDVTRTIHYEYNDGNSIPGLSDTIDTVHWTRTAKIDSVTGDVISYGPWQIDGADAYPSHVSPQVAGFKPDIQSVPQVTGVKETDNNTTVTVKYSPNAEHAEVQYVDDDENGKVVVTDEVPGDYDQTVTYDPTAIENKLRGEGYIIGNSNLPANNQIYFGNDGYVPVYRVHLTHGMKTVPAADDPTNQYNTTSKVTRTIHYQYSNGQPVPSLPDRVDSVTYTRTATVDEVTNKPVSYTDWTTTNNTMPYVQIPSLTGYTPNQTSVKAETGVEQNWHSWTDTVTYTPNAEHAVVNYIDDTDGGKIIHSDTVSGVYDGTTVYDPSSEESTLTKQGYVIGNSNLPAGGKITFTQDGQVPTYTIHVTHGTHTVTPAEDPDNKYQTSHSITRTIHYQNSNGQPLSGVSDVTQTVTYHRTATVDSVTGKTLSYTDWQPVGTPDYPAQQSPAVTGYTPDTQTVPEVDNIPETAQNSTVTVTYNANKEHAVVNYVDDTDGGKIVHSDTVNGYFDQTSTYDPTSEENTLKNQGYIIGSTDLPANGKITFTKDGDVPTYTIHLTHGTHTVDSDQDPDNKYQTSHSITRTIHYQYSNGQNIPGVSDVTQTVTYHRVATVDSVTGKALSYTDWQPVGTPDYPAQQSPNVVGYTPDQPTVPEVDDVPETASNSTVTVNYNANKEHAVVNYVDDTDGGKIIHTDTVNGYFDQTSTYDPSSEENTLKNAGYIIGNSDLPAGGKITFTQDGQVPTYTIHVTHGTTTYTPQTNPDGKYDLTHVINRNIHYQYQNGQPVPSVKDITDTVTYNRTVTVDNVTHQVVSYSDWTPENGVSDFPDHPTPTVTGYTPDKTDVPEVAVQPDDKSQTVTVTYNNNPEHAVVNYVDDTDGGKIVHSDTVNGHFDETSTYDPTSEENTLKNQGYIIGSTDLPANGQITFTKDGDVPTYTVHLTHGTHTVDSSQDPDNKYQTSHSTTRTIHYQYSNGNAVPGVKDVTQTVTYHRTATVDSVTGQAISYTPWQPVGTPEYPAQQSPAVTGYTPDTQTVPEVDNVPEDAQNSTVTVTYNANKEHAVVNYVDDTDGGKIVHSDTVNGYFDQTSTYDPTSEENTLKNAGYIIGNSNLPANGQITFTQDGQVPTYTVHLTHGTHTVDSDQDPDNKYQTSHSTTRTIHYEYSNGQNIPGVSDVTQTVTYHRVATVDSVTGKALSYTDWQPVGNPAYPAQDSPKVTGYTPNIATVPEADNIPETAANSSVTVVYSANPEHAVINYVDDTEGGKIIHSDTVNGHFDQTSTYDPSSEENTLTKQGYVIGNSNLPAGGKITFTQDGQVPTYTIHVTHGTTTYTPEDNPNGKYDLTNTHHRIIRYTTTDGEQITSTTDTVTFHRNVIVDNVTGKIVKYTPWVTDNGSSTGTYPEHTSPAEPGLYPESDTTPAETVTPDSPATEIINVQYGRNKEHAIVNYVDDDEGGKVIASDTVNGVFGGETTYDPTNTENKLKHDGYVLGNSNLPKDDKIDFSQDGKVPVYTVHMTHGTTTINPSTGYVAGKRYDKTYDLTHDVTRTIKYQSADGKTLASTVVDTVHFTRTAKIDAVTGKVISYSKWVVDGTDSFPGHESPSINGYTPDQTSINGEDDITANMQDQTITVTYKANPKPQAKGNGYGQCGNGNVDPADSADPKPATLPMTGANNQVEGTLSIVGLTLADILVMFGLAGAYRKQKAGDLTREEDQTTGKK